MDARTKENKRATALANLLLGEYPSGLSVQVISEHIKTSTATCAKILKIMLANGCATRERKKFQDSRGIIYKMDSDQRSKYELLKLSHFGRKTYMRQSASYMAIPRLANSILVDQTPERMVVTAIVEKTSRDFSTNALNKITFLTSIQRSNTMFAESPLLREILQDYNSLI